MRIRNTIRILGVTGVCAVVLPAAVMAATPGSADFGKWDATGGVIDNTSTGRCPTGFTCTQIIGGDGFLQSNVTETANPSNVFVQTIVTDTGATGSAATLPFSDESFVKTDGTGMGVLDNQVTKDTTSNFTSTSTLATGTFSAAGIATIDINQSFSDNNGTPAITSDDFSTMFNLAIETNETTGTIVGKTLDITEDVGLGTADPSTDKQKFVFQEKSGTKLTTAGTLTLAQTSTTPANGGTVNWVAGDDVLVVWIGQQINLGGAGGAPFAFESIENKGPSEVSTADTFSRTSNDINKSPFDWDVPTFGAAPTL